MSTWAIYTVFVLAGVALGILIGECLWYIPKSKRPHYAGRLIFQRDPDSGQIYMFLRASEEPDIMLQHNEVLFAVDDCTKM